MHWVDPVEPIVSMESSAFRTYTLRTVGIQATRIAPATKWAQRLVVRHGEDGEFVFLSSSTAELESVGGAFPIGSYALSDAQPTVLVLAPEQGLYAVGSIDNIEFSVSRSQAIPAAHDPGPLNPSTFRGHNLRIAAGLPNAAKQIAPPSPRPQRVVIRDVTADVFISPSVTTLNQGAPPFGGAYRLAAVDGEPQTFVTAPGQALYAAPLGVQTLFVAVSEISPASPVGPTGIPSPDGEE